MTRTAATLFVAGLCGAAVIIACSSSDSSASPGSTGGDGGGGDAAFAPPDPKAFAHAQCEMNKRCRSEAFVAFYWGSASECETAVNADLTRTYAAPGITVTQAQVAACIAAVDSIACTEINEQPTSCDFRGSLEDGEACAYGAQCSSGSCFIKLGSTCGLCTATAPEGGDCSKAECTLGQNLRCSDKKKCAVRAEDGEACGPDKPCRSEHECIKSICAARLPQGATCSTLATSLSCDLSHGTFCVPTADGKSGTCEVVKPARVGEKCGLDVVSRVFSFCTASTCPDLAAGSTCIPYLKEGATCGSDENDTSQCDPYLVCKDKKCAALGCE